MEKNYYRIKRDGDKLKVKLVGWRDKEGQPHLVQQISQTTTKPQTPVAPPRTKRSVWQVLKMIFSKIASGLTLFISILVMIVALIAAAPFFIVMVIFNWFRLVIAFGIAYWIITALYYYFIETGGNPGPGFFNPFTDIATICIFALALIMSVFFTIEEIRS